MFESWYRVISKPEVATFDAEATNASLQRTVVNWLIASVVSTLFGVMMLTIYAASMAFALMAEGSLELPLIGGLTVAGVGGLGILYFVWCFFSLWIASGIHYLIAKHSDVNLSYN